MNARNPTRLFADAHVFDAGYQGTRSFLLGLYTELARIDGLEIFLGAQDCANLRRVFAPVAGRIHFISYKSRSRYGRLLWEIPAILQQQRIDYAHFQYVAPLRKVCAYIVTTHDLLFEEFPGLFPYFYRSLRRSWFRNSALNADILTTVSRYAAQSIARHYGIAEEGIAIVPNAVAPMDAGPKEQQAARHRLRERYGVDRYLLCVSRVEPRKNQELLVTAFRQLELAAQGYQLVVIGNRSVRSPALDAALAQLRPFERAALWMLHDIPEAELQDWYLGCRLFLYPSLGEGFGIPPLEAAMAGVPVLCSNRTALADFDFFGDDLVDPADGKAFNERIGALLQQPVPTVVLQQRAQEITRRYSWRASAISLFAQIHAHHAQTVQR